MPCAVDGCTVKYPTYGKEIGERPSHCAHHGAPLGMTNVKDKKCIIDGCQVRPNYGEIDGPAKYCMTHGVPLGMVDVKHKKCIVDGCGSRIWGNLPDGFPKLCLGCFDFQNPGHPRVKKHKIKETFLIKQLNMALPEYEFIWDRIVINECKILNRPDAMHRGVHRICIVECDESPHNTTSQTSQYGTTCEQVRNTNLFIAGGYVPIHFFRFDTDTSPKAIVVSEIGIVSKGPGWDQKFNKLINDVRTFFEWDAMNPLGDEPSHIINYY